METENSLLVRLEKLGIEFAFGGPDGHLLLTVDEVVELLAVGDRDEFIAAKFHVSMRHLRLYYDFIDINGDGRQCKGTTVKGKRCKNETDRYEVNGIKDFDPEYDLYCNLHKPY